MYKSNGSRAPKGGRGPKQPHRHSPKKHSEKNNQHQSTGPATIDGTISINARGVGYVSPLLIKKSKETDFQVSPQDLNTALHGDTVRAFIISKRDGTARIEKIILRAKTGFAGILAQKNGSYIVEPSDPKMYVNIVLTNDKSYAENIGKKVFARITKWDDPKTLPFGIIEQVLGAPGENDVEMQAIALERGFGSGFPEHVEREAQEIKKNEKADMDHEATIRRDMRDTTTFTIDPFDAKDFDDALSVKKVSDGIFEIGIHIADVSHYVKPNTELEKEALRRATSVYLVDRTIPMLPEILSNDLCSLKQDVDRLAMSAIFTMDMSGEILSEWYGKTIIHSNKRFTYEEAQEVLDTGKGKYHDELILLNTISKKLGVKRFNDGAVSLEQDEVRFKLDDKGVPISVYKKSRIDTNKLIEEFMLLANKKVTEHVGHDKFKGERIFLYRIHDKPEASKINDLGSFLASLGHKIAIHNGQISSQDINVMLEKLEGKPERNTVATAIIRAQAKAIYSTDNRGHHGLAFDHYTHFTSPIRRYPDIIVHRLIHDYLGGKMVAKKDWPKYDAIAKYTSEREKAASDAERASIKYKQVEYMSYRIGETFNAIISGVTDWGMYAEETETKCEGMITLKSLTDDYYSLDQKIGALVGQKTKKKYRIGDVIRVKVQNADMKKKMIDYILV